MSAETASLDPRALSLDALAGQPAAQRALTALARAKETPPLLLFGPEGVGKRRAAFAMLASLTCEAADDDGLACGACRACRRVLDAARTPLPASRDNDAPQTYPDVGWVSVPKDRTRISVGQARDVISSMSRRPFELSHRGYVLEPIDRATPSAANSLLKILEEPPSYGVLILVTSRPWSLPITVRSRVRPVRFGALPTEVVRQILIDGGTDADEADDRARRARGSVALAAGASLEDDARRIEVWLRILEGLARGVAPAPLAVAASEELASDGVSASNALALLMEIVRDVLVPGEIDELCVDAEPSDAVRDHLIARFEAGYDALRTIDQLRLEIEERHRNPRLAVEGAVLALAGLYP